MPPVFQELDCQATSLPLLSAAIFTRANPEGRMPATSNSSLRASIIFTGLPPADFDSLAATMSQRSAANLLPKPPPIFCCKTRMLAAGVFNGAAICAAMPERFWVEICTVRSLPFHSEAEPCDSRQQCTMQGTPYTASCVAAAEAKA